MLQTRFKLFSVHYFQVNDMKVLQPIIESPSSGMLQRVHENAFRAAETIAEGGNIPIQAGFLTAVDDGRKWKTHRGYVYDPYRGEVLIMAQNPSGLEDYRHIEALASELGVVPGNVPPLGKLMSRLLPFMSYTLEDPAYNLILRFSDQPEGGQGSAESAPRCVSMRYITSLAGRALKPPFSLEGSMLIHASWYVPDELEEHARWNRETGPIRRYPDPACTKCFSTISSTTDRGLGARDGAPVQFLEADYREPYEGFGPVLAGAVAGPLGIKLTGQDNICVAYR
jgi:hypothetical protein